MIEILPMVHDHIDEVLEIEKTCFGAGWTSTPFKKELERKDCSYFIAKENEKILGYCGAWLIVEELHIIIISVLPQFRQKKIGQQLLIKLLEDGLKNGAKWSTLEVKASNIPAQRMYEKFGFSVKGVRKKYYQQDGEDALIMWTEEIDTKEYADFLIEQNKY
ncbi:MAG: ribosomal protein S18-alanine N-acetyltransferase [Candidatus Sericytochromatia bacterium]